MVTRRLCNELKGFKRGGFHRLSRKGHGERVGHSWMKAMLMLIAVLATFCQVKRFKSLAKGKECKIMGHKRDTSRYPVQPI